MKTETQERLGTGIYKVTSESGLVRYYGRVNNSEVKNEYSERFKTEKDATKWRDDLLKKLLDGKAPVDAKKLTVGPAITAFLKDRAESTDRRLAPNKINEYERVRDDLYDMRIRKMTYQTVSHYLELLLKSPVKRDANRPAGDTRPIKTYSPASVRKFYYCLKTALEWHAKVNRYSLDEHLFNQGVGDVPAAWSGRRDRRLRAGEEERLYAAGIERGDITYTKAEWRAMIGFALATAMRQQEIVRAEWRDVASDNLMLVVRRENAKGGIDRTIPLSKAARAVLEQQRKSCPKDEPRIFHQWPSPDAVCESFIRLTKRAGIEDLHFHDLRHEATSRICETSGHSQMHIMQMTGHKTLAAFQGYLHLFRHESAVLLD